MIKKTLYFENPAYLSMKNKQLVIKLPEVEKNDSLPESFRERSVHTIPIEDIGVVILDNKQLNIPVLDVVINEQRSPLMLAAAQTTASLAKCYIGEARKIAYPSFT